MENDLKTGIQRKDTQGFQKLGDCMPITPMAGTPSGSKTSAAPSGDTGTDLTPESPLSDLGIRRGPTGLTATSVTGPRPQAEDVRDILWTLSTIKPWQTSIDPKDAKNALNVLELALIPLTTDEAVHWLTRLLAHFPRRDPRADGVITADLAADMTIQGVSLVALVAICDDVRREATKADPWFPPSGDILRRAVKQTNTYKKYVNELKNPRISGPARQKPAEPPASPWAGMAWEDMGDPVRRLLAAFLKPLDLGIARTYCKVMKFDYDVVSLWIEQNEKVEK